MKNKQYINKLLKKIAFYENKYPQKELAEIINNKELAIPLLLDNMKYTYNNYENYLNEDYNIRIYPTYLLAQFRVKEFFNIFLKIANKSIRLTIL